MAQLMIEVTESDFEHFVGHKPTHDEFIKWIELCKRNIEFYLHNVYTESAVNFR